MKIKDLFLNLKSKISLSGKNKKFLTLGIVLLCLILFSVFAFPKTKSSESFENEEPSLSIVESREYEDEIELKIKQMLLAMSEVSVANVMVFCDSSIQYNYLKNISEIVSGSGESMTKTKTEEVVYEKNGSDTSPIITSKIKPKIKAVWIVINQVSPSTKLAIINSIGSVLNLDSSSISILQEWKYENFIF